jgi:phosphopantetheine--protein transferase-like protein
MLTVGVDCENISRFRRTNYNKKSDFYKKIFTPKEIKYCKSKRDPYPHFTVRFAAKEAVIKALSGFGKVFYKDIEIKNKKSGKPYVALKKKSGRVRSIQLSLTHSKDQAVAFVVCDIKNKA